MYPIVRWLQNCRWNFSATWRQFRYEYVLTTSAPVVTWWFIKLATIDYRSLNGIAPHGCRPATVVWRAVQTTSAVITHWPARCPDCPPVAVFNCWRPSFRCRWNSLPLTYQIFLCAIHCHDSFENSQHFYLDSHIFCFSFYRAMLRRARYCYGKLSVRPSARPWRWGTLIT